MKDTKKKIREFTDVSVRREVMSTEQEDSIDTIAGIELEEVREFLVLDIVDARRRDEQHHIERVFKTVSC